MKYRVYFTNNSNSNRQPLKFKDGKELLKAIIYTKPERFERMQKND